MFFAAFETMHLKNDFIQTKTRRGLPLPGRGALAVEYPSYGLLQGVPMNEATNSLTFRFEKLSQTLNHD